MANALECEDCGEEVPKGKWRRRCPHCNLLVCPYCYHHAHGPMAATLDASRRYKELETGHG